MRELLYKTHANPATQLSSTFSSIIPDIESSDPTAGRNCSPTRWITGVSLTPDYGVLRDQICTTSGPKVSYVRQVHF